MYFPMFLENFPACIGDVPVKHIALFLHLSKFLVSNIFIALKVCCALYLVLHPEKTAIGLFFEKAVLELYSKSND